MQFLIDFAAEDPEFRVLLERAQEFPTVQGVVLDIDRLWLRAWARHQLSGDSRSNDIDFERWYDGYWAFPKSAGLVWPEPIRLSDIEGGQPESWRYLQKRWGFAPDRSPIQAKVCIRPRTSDEERYPTVADLYVDGGRLQISIEARTRARLSSNPRKTYSPVLGGVSVGVGANDFGTLGVILTDGQGKTYALTCSHVAAKAADLYHPSRRDLSSASKIGQSVLASPLTVCPVGTACNPWSGATAHEIDVSLIELDPGKAVALLEVLDVGRLTGVTPRASLSPLQVLEVMGRTSGFNAMQVGGLAVWYSFLHDGHDYCYHNLFEVESPYGAPGVIKLGDSGGPVCSPDATGTAWAGLIAGRDAFKGYAMYSETIVQWLDSKGYRLSVL